MTLLKFVRWIHIFGSAGWFGEVVVIVFVLVPLIYKMPDKDQPAYIAKVFPRLFRLASVFTLLVIFSGIVMNYLMTGWSNLGNYISSFRGMAITLGGLLGLAVALFHFFIEFRIESRVASLAETLNKEELVKLTRYLVVIPRVGILILVTVFILMMIGARGL